VSRGVAPDQSILPGCVKVVHPPSNGPARTRCAALARTRCPCGTQRGSLTAASFRIWRGSRRAVAQDPAVNASAASRIRAGRPREGIQPR